MRRRISCSSSSALFSFFFLLSWPACSVSSGEDTLSPDRPLLDDGATALVSSGGRFRLGFFSPNGSTNRYVGIWYNKISIQTVVWVANRRQPIATLSGNLSLTNNGILIITGEDNSTAIWSSGSPASGLRNPVARILDDGNFVVVEEAGSNDDDPNSFAWQSFDFPSDTFLPGMVLRQKQLRTGAILNINFTAWMSSTDPAPGQYTLGLNVQGDPQVFIWRGTQPFWRGGPWNGRWFSGIPEVAENASWLINVNVEQNINQISYSAINQSSVIVREIMDSSGHIQILVWIEAEQRWSVCWDIPKDPCDLMSSCGPNTYCSSNTSPQCACLPAFHPRNQRNWDLWDWSDGCTRTTPLDCQNNTDGFFTLSGTKLPDTSRSTVNANLSLVECRALCFSNCSCRAYAPSNISGIESGCLIWTDDLTDIKVYRSGLGQDLYVRLAAADLASAISEALRSHSNRNILMIVLLPLAILFLASVAYSIWRWKKRSSHIDYEAEEKDMELPLFDLNTIKDATDGFSTYNKLGQGGFGPVYKGKLGEDQQIAVKRLSKTSSQGVDEFKNEITLIAKLQHRNLVKLLGCCIQGGERLLIYEYMFNGSLDTFLFGYLNFSVKLKLYYWIGERGPSGELDLNRVYSRVREAKPRMPELESASKQIAARSSEPEGSERQNTIEGTLQRELEGRINWRSKTRWRPCDSEGSEIGSAMEAEHSRGHVRHGEDTLSPDRPLLDDGATALVSSGGRFRLGFFSPNGSTNRYVGIWYNNISIQTVVWVANRRQPITARSGNLSLTRNGTLILTGEDTSTLSWSSESPNSALRNPVARLLDDGNLVVQEVDSNGNDPNSFAWQSFDFPTDTLLPGMVLGQKQLRTGAILNINLTAWMSSTDPAPGQYTLGLNVQGDPQIFIWTGTQPFWRGGPWNGLWFSGIPEVTEKASWLINVNVEQNINQVSYSAINQSSVILREIMDSSGHIQLLVWIEAEQRWSDSWDIPKDPCDLMSSCGPNSYCSSNTSPQCACLPAFHPRNQRNWDLWDWVDGCMRTTPLDCLNNTDGFFTLSGTKLPDTSRSTVNANLSLVECRALCFSNCSCRAYAPSNISGIESGCLIWTDDLTDIKVYRSGLGQDLYVRSAAADLASAISEALRSHSNRNILMIVLLPLAILFLASVAYSIWRWKKRSSHIDYEAEEKDMELPLFDLNTIKDATDDFSTDNKLGQGGFGPVYKGKLGEDQQIAVKRLSKTSSQGVDEFKNEITLIAKLQHRNLVKLLGCCIQGGERLLIYEYMFNGSLDKFLFGEAQTVLLDWRARYNIILGVARGLLYLHHDSRLRIVHRDLKASNILLDKDMNPKISDFGPSGELDLNRVYSRVRKAKPRMSELESASKQIAARSSEPEDFERAQRLDQLWRQSIAEGVRNNEGLEVGFVAYLCEPQSGTGGLLRSGRRRAGICLKVNSGEVIGDRSLREVERDRRGIELIVRLNVFQLRKYGAKTERESMAKTVSESNTNTNKESIVETARESSTETNKESMVKIARDSSAETNKKFMVETARKSGVKTNKEYVAKTTRESDAEMEKESVAKTERKLGAETNKEYVDHHLKDKHEGI
ncbi:hypothetical protein ZIOFF_038193 [Zingiber officinale]|uniref:non-specific serine/threonine protein kinase n=1 Tax=Zingiber officinale TaxID=94328 RepID=A0A8J5L4N3_ZINOF|nr:hypothetical protein ZIOFF_038193 [Zingiber officinale]